MRLASEAGTRRASHATTEVADALVVAADTANGGLWCVMYDRTILCGV
jgi:hypothetical protein